MEKLWCKFKVIEVDLCEMMCEIWFVLLEVDVNFKVVKDFVKMVCEKVVGVEVLKGLNLVQ